MSEELPDSDPFGEEGEPEEKEDLITDAMVRKATFHIHKLAERKKKDFKEIQKKCRDVFGYTNLAKVTRSEGHKIIDDLVKRTGGEEEARPATDDNPKPQLPTTPTDGLPKRESTAEATKKEEKETETEEDLVTATMRKSIRAAVDITIKEVVDKEVPVQGLGGFVLEIGKVIFEAKMSEVVDK